MPQGNLYILRTGHQWLKEEGLSDIGLFDTKHVIPVLGRRVVQLPISRIMTNTSPSALQTVDIIKQAAPIIAPPQYGIISENFLDEQGRDENNLTYFSRIIRVASEMAGFSNSGENVLTIVDESVAKLAIAYVLSGMGREELAKVMEIYDRIKIKDATIRQFTLEGGQVIHDECIDPELRSRLER